LLFASASFKVLDMARTRGTGARFGAQSSRFWRADGAFLGGELRSGDVLGCTITVARPFVGYMMKNLSQLSGAAVSSGAGAPLRASKRAPETMEGFVKKTSARGWLW